MDILYYPFENSTNKYIEISQNILKSCGCSIHALNMKDLLLNRNRYDALFLNWYESIYDCRTESELKREILKRKLKFKLIQLLGVKIVFTFHNKAPHDTEGKKNQLLREFIKWICQNSDYIIILSQASRDYLLEYLLEDECSRKIMYIPHPNYIGVYSKELETIEYPKSDNLNVLFVGQIKPYKNIELILESAKRLSNYNIKFVIAGSCTDQKYRDELVSISSGLNNVDLRFGFITDENLEVMVRKSDIMLLPYNMESSLNSGTAILAFSNARTVICPRIATIKEYDLSGTYSYVYSSSSEHLKAMEEQILAAYNDWKNNKDTIKNKGIDMFNAVKKYNSTDALKARYEELLKAIDR